MVSVWQYAVNIVANIIVMIIVFFMTYAINECVIYLIMTQKRREFYLTTSFLVCKPLEVLTERMYMAG